jgi:hypothetical protein
VYVLSFVRFLYNNYELGKQDEPSNCTTAVMNGDDTC